MNRGAERLQELFPDRGGVRALAEAMGTCWSVASRWRSGDRKPTTRFRVRLHGLFGIDLLDWDVVVVAVVELPAEPIAVAPEPEAEPIVEEPARLVRSLRPLTGFGHASR